MFYQSTITILSVQ